MPDQERYIQHRDGAWYVGGSGVSAYSVIALWRQGLTPEEIQTSFSAVSLREVYGTILYYLEHRDEMETSFRAQDSLFESLRAQAEGADPTFNTELRERIARFRAAAASSPSATAS